MTVHLEIESDDERLVVYCEDRDTYGLQDRKDQSCYTPNFLLPLVRLSPSVRIFP